MAAPIKVIALNRYPVKSTFGESPDELMLDHRGVVGDRLWSVRNTEGKIGSGKTTRRFAEVPGLLSIRSRLCEDGSVSLSWDGVETSWPADDPATAVALSERLGRPLTLARETDVSHYDDGPVSLLGAASVGAVTAARGVEVDPARFRANLLLSTAIAYVEQSWVGRTLRVGEAELIVALVLPRCVMVNLATADLPSQPGNLAVLGGINDGRLGIMARVAQPGRVRIGDELVVD